MALHGNRKATIRCLIRGSNGLGEWHAVTDNQPFLVREKPTGPELTMPEGYRIDSTRSQIIKTKVGLERVLVFNEGNPDAISFDIPTVGLDAIKVGILVGPLVARIKLMGLNARSVEKKFPFDWKIMLLGAAIIIVLGIVGGHYLWPNNVPVSNGRVGPAGT